MGRRTVRTKQRAIVAAVVLAATTALLLWWRWPTRAWTLWVEASDSDVPPWTSVDLSATLAPRDAPRRPLHWQWTDDGEEFSNEGPDVPWRSGEIGSHRIEVTAVAADGVRHHASIEVTVRSRPYVTAAGTHMAPPPAPPRVETTVPFRIADVWVEKRRICQGEPTRVRMTAADARGQEKWLRPNIDGQQAWEITYVPALLPPGLQRIHVSLIDDLLGRHLVESDAYVEVEDCITPYPVFVQARHVPPYPERVALVAAVMRGRDWQLWSQRRAGDDAAIPKADVARYRWTFGDGTTETSTEPRIDHVYPDEASRGLERATDYRVMVDALDDAGQKMGSGYVTVSLVNAYRNLERTAQTLQLVATVAPGPARTEDDTRTLAVTLRNIDPGETAHLSRLALRFVGCDGKSITERQADVRSVFAEDEVPPRGTIDGKLGVATSDLHDVCAVDARLDGTSRPGGLRVAAFFAMDPGGRRGRALDERQAAAMAQLNDALGDAGVVTLEMIRKLEDEGRVPRGALAPDPYVASVP
jgi:hypothetical protein